jgi:hypothetical protein
MKIDFETPFKTKFFTKAFSNKIFREYQHFEPKNHGMLEIKPRNENQE